MIYLGGTTPHPRNHMTNSDRWKEKHSPHSPLPSLLLENCASHTSGSPVTRSGYRSQSGG